VMIALHNVVDAQNVSLVAGNGETDCVRPVARRKSRAVVARVAEVAALAQGGVVGLKSAGNRAAVPGPGFAERQGGAAAPHFDREKIRAGHFARYSNTRMSTTRLETLKSLSAQNPQDAFLRYGLAMEYRNAGDLGSALREFQGLMEGNPDYCATYFHAG